MLVKSNQSVSQLALLSAEAQALRSAGWQHPRQPVSIDWDGSPPSPNQARRTESWVAPHKSACAYVTTDDQGVAAEGKLLFPYDPYNQPEGVRRFYKRAKELRETKTLWVRLQPVVGWC